MLLMLSSRKEQAFFIFLNFSFSTTATKLACLISYFSL